MRVLRVIASVSLNGEQAAGKSTRGKILRLRIDPQVCPVLGLPSSTENLMATAANGWLKGVRSVKRFARAGSSLILEHKTADQIRYEAPLSDNPGSAHHTIYLR
jgi:hypothetical protein